MGPSGYQLGDPDALPALTMPTNRQAGLDFRNRVLIYLLNFGFKATDPFKGRRLAETVGEASALTDIGGIDPWIIDVRTSNKAEISTALNDARAAARVAGTDWYVAIMSRRGRPIEDAYAIVPLHLMARIFAGQNPTSELRLDSDSEDSRRAGPLSASE